MNTLHTHWQSRLLGVLALLLCLPACTRESTPPEAGRVTSVPFPAREGGQGPRFERLSPAITGLDFHSRFEWDHPRKHLYMHGYAGGGVAVGDYDGDGRPDIYLTGQASPDRLYRQVGDLRFQDVTAASGLEPGDAWGTGAIFVDVDDDGDLDLYDCNYDAPNQLWINQGDGTFEEEAAARGVAFSGASVMAAFADHDRDGDLDLYVLTNRLYPGPTVDHPETMHVDGKVQLRPGQEESFFLQERVIDGETQKFVVKAGQRDRLYRNEGGGSFTEIGEAAGISGNHPGLSVTWWDYDRDGYPDLYIGNDFWDPDRLYRNRGNGTFEDVLAGSMPHTPWFSMGADFGDLDGDGHLDLIAADMSASTHFWSKIMMGDMNDSRWFLQSAEPRQYMRNAVYLGTGTPRFREAAHLTGLASTDWTWSVKLGDLDGDGHLDAFFTNGTANHSFDPDLTRRMEAVSRRLARGGADARRHWDAQWELYRSVPPRRERNLAFANRGDLHFDDRSTEWGLDHEGISFGAALADLDRDGDLDVIVQNIDDPVSVYRNRSSERGRILVRLHGLVSNRHGIGSTVTIRTGNTTQVRQLHPTRGYMSANEPLLHFGVGSATTIDHLKVEWPSGRVTELTNLEVGRFYTIVEPGPQPETPAAAPPSPLFQEASYARGLRTGAAGERPFDDFALQPLLPARLSRLGPGLAWGDADGDGDDDVFVGGAAGQAGQLFLADGKGRFAKKAGPWQAEAECEDLGALWLDADGDGDLDLFVASGGIEAGPDRALLQDRLYLQEKGQFRRDRDRLPPAEESSFGPVGADFDRDGDIDLFVGSRSVPGAYPRTPTSRLLRQEPERFTDVTASLAPGLAEVGMVTGALWSDVDGDGWIDLLVTLDWGPVRFFRNREGRLIDQTEASGLASRVGWWNAVAGGDLDGDEDIDYVVLNAGLNTKYRATPEKPAVLFSGRYPGQDRDCLVEAKGAGDALLPQRGLSCSSSAIPPLRQHMRTYRQFAGAQLTEIYPPGFFDGALRLEVNHLESGVLINEGSRDDGVTFRYQPLPRIAQVSPGQGVTVSDVDGDGHTDVYLVQNFYWREPETGRWNGGLSQLLRGAGDGTLVPVPPRESGLIITGDARGLAICDLDGNGRPDFTVTRNGDRLLAYENHGSEGRWLAVTLEGGPGNPHAVGARVTLSGGGGPSQTLEVYAGSGYLSQSAPALYFGLRGTGSRELTVRWPDGETTQHPVDGNTTNLRVRPR